MSNALDGYTTQSFLLNPTNYSGIELSSYYAILAEIRANNPAKYAACRSFLITNMSARIHKAVYLEYYVFLGQGRTMSGESYLGLLGNPGLKPGIPGQDCTKFAMQAADAAAEYATRAIDLVLPPDSQPSRIYVGNDVRPENPVVPGPTLSS